MKTQTTTKKTVKRLVKVSRGVVANVTFSKKPLVVVAKAKGFERITVMPNAQGNGFSGYTKSSGSWTAKTPAKAFARAVKKAWAA